MVGSNYCAIFFMIMVWIVFLLSSDLVIAKSRAPISEAETQQKKNDCYADIESGLWGQQCTSSSIARENCALRCLSPTCYELIYESDPEAETRQKKNDCYADIESGLWGQQCTSSNIARENCALRCLSQTCYKLIYESDPAGFLLEKA